MSFQPTGDENDDGSLPIPGRLAGFTEAGTLYMEDAYLSRVAVPTNRGLEARCRDGGLFQASAYQM